LILIVTILTGTFKTELPKPSRSKSALSFFLGSQSPYSTSSVWYFPTHNYFKVPKLTVHSTRAMKADKHPSGIPAPPQQPKPLYNLTPLSQVLLQSKRDLALLRTNRNQIAIAPISASASQLAVPGIINSGTPALPTTPRSPRPGSLAASAPQLPNVIQQQRSTPLQSLSPTQAQFQSSAQPQSHSPPQASSSIPLPNQGQGLGLIANAVNTSQNAGPSAAAGQAQQTVDFDAMEAKLDLFISFYDEVPRSPHPSPSLIQEDG
jgi:hypothetical protein